MESRNTLLATTDATVWAEEFCRIFDGYVIGKNIGEAAMVTWFANAIETGSLRTKPIHLGTWHAFLHFFHMDHANASMHCSTVRYSPITFRLAEFIAEMYPSSSDDPRLVEVLEHLGQYEEDAGR